MNNTTKITGKSTKGEMLAYLTTTGETPAMKAKTKEAKNLVERVVYAMQKGAQDLAKVSKTDLLDLIKEVDKFIGTPVGNLAPIENSLKPKLKNKDKAPAKETAPKEKTPVEKAPAKDKVPAKDGETVTTLKTVAKEVPMAKMFPKNLEHPDLGKFIAVPEKYHTMKELSTALESGTEIVFACYWNKRAIKEFNYAGAHNVSVPKQFPNDLDLVQAVLVCTNSPMVYAMSSYTEAMFRFDEEDLQTLEFDNDGMYTLRLSGGLEYEIYEKIAEEETK